VLEANELTIFFFILPNKNLKFSRITDEASTYLEKICGAYLHRRLLMAAKKAIKRKHLRLSATSELAEGEKKEKCLQLLSICRLTYPTRP